MNRSRAALIYIVTWWWLKSNERSIFYGVELTLNVLPWVRQTVKTNGGQSRLSRKSVYRLLDWRRRSEGESKQSCNVRRRSKWETERRHPDVKRVIEISNGGRRGRRYGKAKPTSVLQAPATTRLKADSSEERKRGTESWLPHEVALARSSAAIDIAHSSTAIYIARSSAAIDIELSSAANDIARSSAAIDIARSSAAVDALVRRGSHHVLFIKNKSYI